MLVNGLSPEQIAAERALTASTIYSHLARLIAQEKINVSAVITEDMLKKIYAAIEEVGSAERLAPIKACLLEDIDYAIIRCAVAAWELEHSVATQQKSNNVSPKKDRAAHVYALGKTGSLEHVPELISALEDPHGNVRRLATSALGKLRTIDAVLPLLALLENETKPQVRQYTIKALGRIGDERARARLEQITFDNAEKEYNRSTARAALDLLGPRESGLPVGPIT